MRATKKGRIGEHVNTLADIKRLRKDALAAHKQFDQPSRKVSSKTYKSSEDMAASKLDEAALAAQRAPAKAKPLSSQFAGLDRMLSSAARLDASSQAGMRVSGAKPAAIASNKMTAPAVSLKDHALFQLAMKSVQPIKDTRRAILPPAPQASGAILRERRERAVGADLRKMPQISDQYAPAKVEADDAHFVQHGYGPDLAKGLKRGKWSIGASLDLHGNTLEEARDRLDRFLQSCLAHHIKCVRIVHGKGYGSKDGESVLKQTIRRWLTQMADVLAYTECAEQDGGSGAVQVLLRVDKP
ncbi:MAG TPA: Smr/MutS family protein [Candidimonas sp.]|nr:Smr/MutS family protein [Candidimonas sp.]